MIFLLASVVAFLTFSSSIAQEHVVTTRYWDCCKPSCGWNGKVSGSNAYVRTCKKDGNSLIIPNAQNVCGGGGDTSQGQSFTCNNNQPWAANDNLAYGFAAATIRGQWEGDLCCACFKLNFVSSPIQGKTMIVQVTNTGADLSGDKNSYFDLAIPGGGVGIFNGCSSQFNAPWDGWGQRYGGVNSRNECNALPAQIRNGCYFRFDWMKGASNPTMTYTRVKCPSELTKITGCTNPRNP